MPLGHLKIGINDEITHASAATARPTETPDRDDDSNSSHTPHCSGLSTQIPIDCKSKERSFDRNRKEELWEQWEQKACWKALWQQCVVTMQAIELLSSQNGYVCIMNYGLGTI